MKYTSISSLWKIPIGGVSGYQKCSVVTRFKQMYTHINNTLKVYVVTTFIDNLFYSTQAMQATVVTISRKSKLTAKAYMSFLTS